MHMVFDRFPSRSFGAEQAGEPPNGTEDGYLSNRGRTSSVNRTNRLLINIKIYLYDHII